MAVIKKKVWPTYFEMILWGKKKYELRLADFDVKEGDELILEEWDPDTKHYTGRTIKKNVTLVLKTKDVEFWPKEKTDEFGYQIISFE